MYELQEKEEALKMLGYFGLGFGYRLAVDERKVGGMIYTRLFCLDSMFTIILCWGRLLFSGF